MIAIEQLMIITINSGEGGRARLFCANTFSVRQYDCNINIFRISIGGGILNLISLKLLFHFKKD